MPKSNITTAAFLAGATTLAVSLPVMAAERSYDLADFDGVKISSGLSAEVSVGEEFSVTAEARTRRTLDHLNIRVRSGTLMVERSGSWTDFSLFSARRDATIRITLPALTNIEATAGSDVYVDGATSDDFQATSSSGADLELANANLGSAEFNVSSGADLTAQGSCETLAARSSSGSGVDATDLVCQSVEAHASSGGDIEVHATQSVNAHASSGGDVSIAGSPAVVEKHESSGGDVNLN
jgi:hypothetical protein